MGLAIPPMDRIKAKWQENAGRAGGSYAYGVENPKVPWETATKLAEKAWEAGIQAALAAKQWAKGVTGSQGKWDRNTRGKGVSNYGTGIAAAGGDYETNFAPFRSVIAALTLPPRGRAGDPANLRRVEIVAKALHDKKVRG